MINENITIQQASKLSGKSVQTIRRAIKAGKIKYRRRKTPQGFNYLINKASICEVYNVKIKEPEVKDEMKKDNKKTEKNVNKTEKTEEVAKEEPNDRGQNGTYISADDFNNFAKTLDKLVSQHAEERQNFLRLVNTLQEKIFILENQMNLLKAPQKSWYQFWK